MKAVEINEYGGPEVLNIIEVEKPAVGDDNILVEVTASSVNPVDWKVAKEMLKFFPGQKLPKRLGSDFAGVVAEVGSNISDFKIDDEVYGVISAIKGGAYANFVLAESGQLSIKPKSIDFADAATVPLAALTAYQALTKIGKLKEGDTVCVNGSSGGVGHFAVQIAKALGAKIVSVCSTKNIEFSKKLGSDEVVDYKTTDITDTDHQFDIFFDAVATKSYFKVFKTLKRGGTYITTLPSLSAIISPLFKLFSGKIGKMINLKSNSEDLRFISELIKSGKLKVNIDKKYSLEEIQQAHRYSETGRVVGKLAIVISKDAQ